MTTEEKTAAVAALALAIAALFCSARPVLRRIAASNRVAAWVR